MVFFIMIIQAEEGAQPTGPDQPLFNDVPSLSFSPGAHNVTSSKEKRNVCDVHYYLRFSNLHENMYSVKISFIMPYRQ